MDISNKSLAFLLVAAIVVSLGGTLVSLNQLARVGFVGMAAQDSGETNFTIQENIDITFVTSQVNFGTGSVNDTDQGGPVMENCTLNSEGRRQYACSGFNVVDQGFRIRNDGNVDVTLNISSNESETEFIGGAAGIDAFQWKIEDNESSCSGGWAAATTYTDVTSPGYLTVCSGDNFLSTDATDLANLEIQLVISQTAFLGERAATITALGYT